MLKLQKSKDKCDALLKATLQLVNQGGIQGASMANIAKLANISPATIYLYYESKQDLINKLYLEVKESFCLHAFKEYDNNQPVKISFKKIWLNIAEYKINQAEEASFLAQCDNTPMIDETTRKESLKYLQPLFDLWIRGQQEGIIKNISPYLLYTFTIYPMAFLLNMNQNCSNYKIDDNLLNQAFQVAWDGIKV